MKKDVGRICGEMSGAAARTGGYIVKAGVWCV